VTIERKWFPLTGPVRPALRRGPTAEAKILVDPLAGPKLALAGRVVTMDDDFRIEADGVVYLELGSVVAVRPRAQPAPPGFEATSVLETGGTIFPGLIELHNHLSYNALPLWNVPKRYDHRGQWPNHPDYRKLISGPMTVIGELKNADGTSPLLPALIRFVECKCLLGGVTTSQGVRLASNAGIQRYYRGLVRNVEQTGDKDLPEAQGRIPDIEAKDAAWFLGRLQKEDSCLLLHLAEGVTDPAHAQDSVARRHFGALRISPTEWALDEHFTGIHSAGLLPEDFDVLASHRSSIVWSPFSNLLLYGGTARVEAAKAAGVTIGLGSDWSPSGSKNLLGELKVAWLYNQLQLHGLFKTRELVAMATRNAAQILKWSTAAGSLSPGKRADLVVIDGASGDAYEALVHARETDVRLVMINGVARYGTKELMGALVPQDQTVKVDGESRRLFLKQETADPAVIPVALSTAVDTLRDALQNIAKLAKKAEKARTRPESRRALDAPEPITWSLALDEIQDTGMELGPRLPFNGPRDFTGPAKIARSSMQEASQPLSTLLGPIELDALTVADDEDFLDLVESEANVPEPIRTGLRALY
jgi:cytosine/adenosine deaminase-related metal-dependent hydrolase